MQYISIQKLFLFFIFSFGASGASSTRCLTTFLLSQESILSPIYRLFFLKNPFPLRSEAQKEKNGIHRHFVKSGEYVLSGAEQCGYQADKTI